MLQIEDGMRLLSKLDYKTIYARFEKHLLRHINGLVNKP